MARISRQEEQGPPVRRNRARAVGTDMPTLGQTAFTRAGFADSTLVTRWTEIVGEEVARLARPIKLVDNAGGGTLTLKAEAAASVFLEHETRSLCARVNAYLGRDAVSKLRFIYGKIATPEPAPEAREASTSLAPDDPVNAFRGPEGLKEALDKLARRR